VKSLCVNLFSSCMYVCVCSYKVTFTVIGILKYDFFESLISVKGFEI